MKLFKKPIFVSISPNAENDDVWLAFCLLFQPWKWVSGATIDIFTQKFKEYIGTKYVFVFDSGRTSFYAILRSLPLMEADEVLVQALTCTAAVNPILWVGAKPIYVDIEKNTYNMSPVDLEKKITSRSRALIIQHTFGLPAELDALLRIAKKHKLIVIEDVAHALGAEYSPAQISGGKIAAGRGQKLGTFLDAAYFSIGKVLVVLARKLKLISLSVYREEKSGGHPGFGPSRMPNVLAILGLNQLKKLERFNEHRIKLSRIYERDLAGNRNIFLPRVINGAKPVFLNFPVQMPDADTAYTLIGALRKQEGMYLENWPARKVIGPKGTDLEKLKYVAGSCPVAEKVAPCVVTLPTSPNTTGTDAWRVAKC